MRQSPNIYLILIILLVSIAQCGLALYLPSLPAIEKTFQSSSSEVQLTVFFYVLGISLSQCFYGPLSDHYGRRKIILWGLSFFIIGSTLAVLALNLNYLFVARILQGIGMGAVMTISRAILRDVFKGKTYIKNASKLASVFAVSPAIFPVLGGYLQYFFGWRANFACMLILALTALLLWFIYFKESHFSICLEKISISDIFKNYTTLIKSPLFLAHTLCGGLIYSGEVIFLTMAPFLIQQKFNLSSSLYGWSMLMAIGGFILGSQASAYLANRLQPPMLIVIGLTFCFLAVILMTIEEIISLSKVFSILFPAAIFMIGAGFVYPNTSVGAIGNFPEKAGTASALLSSLQGGISTFCTIVITMLHRNTFEILFISFLVIIIPSLILGISIFYQERNRILE